MNYLTQIQTAIDYIEEHLTENMTLQNISAAANMSHWHFQRTFKALTNETLKSYVRSRRIVNSLDDLFDQHLSILDIALSSGFESHESYTRAFQKLFGITPSEYRKSAQDRLIFQKHQFDKDYLVNLHQNLSLEPRLYSTEERFFVGVTTEIIGIESEKNNIADKLPQLWNTFVPRMNEIPNQIDDTAYGIISQAPDKLGVSKLLYTACMEVNDLSVKQLPEGMNSICLPSQQYAEFKHQGFVDIENVNQTINYIYSSWLMNSNMRHTYQPDIEIYGSEFKSNSEDSIIYYAIPVESIN